MGISIIIILDFVKYKKLLVLDINQSKNSAMSKLKLTIFAPKIYGIFNPEYETLFAGSEVQLSIIAKEMLKQGFFDVSIRMLMFGTLIKGLNYLRLIIEKRNYMMQFV